jgi:hypothetical protein
MGGVCSIRGDIKTESVNLVGKYERKRTFDRYGHKWNGKIKMGFTETGCKDVD